MVIPTTQVFNLVFYLIMQEAYKGPATLSQNTPSISLWSLLGDSSKNAGLHIINNGYGASLINKYLINQQEYETWGNNKIHKLP